MERHEISEQVRATIRSHSDERLLEMLDAPADEYTAEALEIARAELASRGGAEVVAQRVQDKPPSPDPLVAEYPVNTLASSFNGVGTALYGKRDRHPDGSYVTTKWVIVAHLPIRPLASYRVRLVKANDSLFGTEARYESTEVPLDEGQVQGTYLKAYGSLLAVVVLIALLL